MPIQVNPLQHASHHSASDSTHPDSTNNRPTLCGMAALIPSWNPQVSVREETIHADYDIGWRELEAQRCSLEMFWYWGF
jgi:hypothetical protein